MRESRQEKRTSLKIILMGGLVLLFAGAAVWVVGKNSDPYRTIEKLNAETYLNDGNALRGNLYRIDGTVQGSLAYGDDKSRLFAIQVGSEVPPVLLPVIVPGELSGVNLEKGQKIAMKVEIGENGFIRALESRKP